jgi:hypothetical protein
VIGVLLLFGALQQDTGYARAESLLAAHDLPHARTAAERLVQDHPQRSRAHLLLGRVWLAWPIIGRYTAYREFRRAAELAPADPEPLRWQIRVGKYLRGDDGEAIISRALVKLLAVSPDDEAGWSAFRGLYCSPSLLEAADAALATHPEDPGALVHRAEIALAEGSPSLADSLAARALSRRRPDIPAYVLRAEANFLLDQSNSGYAWYDSALAHAELDSTEELWRTAQLIATPEEAARYRETTPLRRREFLEAFWRVRDPNLVTVENERIREHFQRLSEARHRFPLLHPWASAHHSAAARTLANIASAEEVSDLLWHANVKLPGEAFTDTVARLVLPPVLGQGEVESASGLDARGILWVRHGRPDVMADGVLDARSMTPVPPAMVRDSGMRHEDSMHLTPRAETVSVPVMSWLYATPKFTADIAFAKVAGDWTVTFVSHRQRSDQAKVERMFKTDATSVPAPLHAHAWSVFFAAPGQNNRTDVYCKTVPDTAAAALWTGEDLTVDRAKGPGLLRLTASPGTYELGLDVDSAGVLGRARLQLHVPAFGSGTLRLSSLALAPGDSLADRETVLRAMPADLVYPAGEPLMAYTEIYGYPAEGPLARYTARYTFTPLDGGRPTVFTFLRERPAEATLVEQIVIEPGRIPSGRYRVAVAIAAPSGAIESQTTSVEIVIR